MYGASTEDRTHYSPVMVNMILSLHLEIYPLEKIKNGKAVINNE